MKTFRLAYQDSSGRVRRISWPVVTMAKGWVLHRTRENLAKRPTPKSMWTVSMACSGKRGVTRMHLDDARAMFAWCVKNWPNPKEPPPGYRLSKAWRRWVTLASYHGDFDQSASGMPCPRGSMMLKGKRVAK